MAAEHTEAPGTVPLKQRAGRWLRSAVINLLIIAAVVWGVSWFQSRHLIDDTVAAPDFTLRALDGSIHRLSDYRGRRVLVVFWAPWCTVCDLEADNVARVRRWNADDPSGPVVLSVALSYDSIDAVRQFVADAGEDERFVLLGDASVRNAYRVEAFPTHYIIDAQGRVAYAGQGYTTTLGLHWRL